MAEEKVRSSWVPDTWRADPPCRLCLANSWAFQEAERGLLTNLRNCESHPKRVESVALAYECGVKQQTHTSCRPATRSLMFYIRTYDQTCLRLHPHKHPTFVPRLHIITMQKVASCPPFNKELCKRLAAGPANRLQK